MASQNKQHQDETAIDKMNSQLTAAGDKIANNKKILLWGVGGILAVAAIVMAYLFLYSKPHQKAAYEAYNQVETQVMGNDSLAAVKYKEVADKYKGDTAGKLAALSAGQALYNEGKYEEAAEYLKRFSSDDEVLAANTLVLVGDCYVNLKKYEEAVNYFQDAIRAAGGNVQIVPRVLLKEANVFDEQKKYDKALECYQQIKDGYPEFKLGNGLDIDAYIAREKARLAK